MLCLGRVLTTGDTEWRLALRLPRHLDGAIPTSDSSAVSSVGRRLASTRPRGEPHANGSAAKGRQYGRTAIFDSDILKRCLVPS